MAVEGGQLLAVAVDSQGPAPVGAILAGHTLGDLDHAGVQVGYHLEQIQVAADPRKEHLVLVIGA